jgi:hypothetical protein
VATDGECFACADSSRAIADWVVVILKCIAPPDLSEFDALLRQPTGSSTR